MNVRTLLVVLPLLAATAYGQLGSAGLDRAPVQQPGSEMRTAPLDNLSRERKEPRWWSRAKYPTAAQQLAYAQQLETEGRQKAALKAYDTVVHRWHDTGEAVLAQIARADLLFKMERLEKAFSEYQYLFDHFPGAFDLDRAVARQLDVAKAMLERHSEGRGLASMFKAPELTLPMFERIVENAPQWSETPDVRLARAQLLEKLERYAEAVKAYEAVEQFHPGTQEALHAAYRKTVCLGMMADKSPRDEKLCRRALSACEQFLARYRDSADAQVVRERAAKFRERLALMAYQRATYYDYKARRPDAARVAYTTFLRDFPFSDLADEARARLVELEASAEPPVMGPQNRTESGEKP